MAKRARKPPEESRNYSPYDFSSDLYALMDAHQREFAKSIEKYFCTITDSPSGTGKTTISALKGFEFLRKGLVSKIVYIRLVDDRYLKQGFFPGTLEEKEYKLYKPFFDALAELDVSEKQFKELRDSGQIELSTDTAMRGTNVKNAFVILDETQNARQFSDLRLILTRPHMGDQINVKPRVVLIGHSGQQDNKSVERTAVKKYTPFQAYTYHLTKKPWANYVELVNDYRGPFSQWVDRIEESLAEL